MGCNLEAGGKLFLKLMDGGVYCVLSIYEYHYPFTTTNIRLLSVYGYTDSLVTFIKEVETGDRIFLKLWDWDVYCGSNVQVH